MKLVKKHDEGVPLDELDKEIRSFPELQPDTVNAIRRALHCIINEGGFITNLGNELPTTKGPVRVSDTLRDSAPDPADVVAKRAERELLEQEIGRLPTTWQYTIRATLNGQKNIQIAETLGVTEGAEYHKYVTKPQRSLQDE